MSAQLNIYQLMSAGYILDEAFKHPSLRVTPRTKVLPTLETAQQVVLKTIELLTARTVAERIAPDLQDILDGQELLNGEYDAADNKSDWETEVDEKVEVAIKDYMSVLSADWLGKNMVGTGLHMKDGVSRFAASLGKEVYKQIVHGKTPQQVLSNAGVLMDGIEAALNERLSQTNEENNMASDNEELNTVIQKIADYVGKDYDILEVDGDLDLASDDDDILANGAGARLGLKEEDVQTLQAVRFEHENDTAEYLSGLLAEAVAAGSKKKPAAKAKAKPADKPKAEKPVKADKKAKAAEHEEEAEGGDITADVLSKLKDFGGVKDADMAVGMGVSRATFNNWLNGKSKCEANQSQRDYIRGVIVDRLNSLHECLAEVDGTEAETIF